MTSNYQQFFHKIRFSRTVLGIVSLICLVGSPATAFTIEKHPDVATENGFRVSPAKIEAQILPGNAYAKTLAIDNYTGKTYEFEVSFEDFVGAEDGTQTVELLGDKQSARSLKDFLFVEKKSFTLEHGDRLLLPVTITIPESARPGGYFASVIVSAKGASDRTGESSRAYPGATVVGRVATLFFVTVAGEFTQAGELIALRTKNNARVIGGNDIALRLEYKNTGEGSLNPYGLIEVKDIFGKIIRSQILDPWFALPDSIRTRDVLIKGPFFGRYTITAQVNRGYEDLVDTKEITVYVFPPVKTAAAVIVIGVLLIALAKRLTRPQTKI